MALEENNLFPFIGGKHKVADSIVHLRDDHDEIQNDLFKIRKMTHNYQLPIELDKIIQRFYAKLVEMDRILLNHIQIENSILFPMLQDT